MIQKKHRRNGSFILISLMLSFIFVLGTCYLSSEGLSTFDLDISLGSGSSGRYAADNYTGKTVNESGVQLVLYNISEQYSEEIEKIESIVDSDKIKAEDKQQIRYGEIRNELDRLSDKDLAKRFPEKYISEPTDKDGKVALKGLQAGVYYIREKNTGSRVKLESIVIKLPIGNYYEKTSKIFPKASIVTNGNNGGGNEGVGEKGGKRFLKTDDGDKFKGLPNAKFIISKKEKGKMVTVKRNGKDLVLESDSDGRFQVDGLEYGEYYLIETQAPIVDSVVYNVLEKPVAFTVDKNSFDENHTLRIVDIEVGKTPNPERNDGEEKDPTEKKKIPETDKVKTPDTKERESGEKYQKNEGEKKPIKIPKTGDIQIYIYSVFGIIIMAIGTFMYKKEIKILK